MNVDPLKPRQRAPFWIWLSADGTRWRINHTSDGIWSCPIGTGGKRLGAWKTGLPPSLDLWPDILKQE